MLSEKDSQLQAKKTSLADVNRRQTALANLQSDFDSVKPDITLICVRLVLFSEIWASVRCLVSLVTLFDLIPLLHSIGTQSNRRVPEHS